jgi:invasion protein IalB
MQTPYVICLATGCMADFALTPELLVKLKSGQNLVVQALNSNGALLRLPLPLQDIAGVNFGKAYDGPPSSPPTETR